MTIRTRRTFAIISHPDAGKTTLTEKLLLEGGAIHIAGEVKARGQARHAHSDWMEIEKKRGISIASSVMTFEYRDATINLLDTPGHQDFSEDTYRTLSAVDSAIMVLDAAKGIETQTRKLFEVCRLRDIPIITFINKMDREAKDPFELLEEIEKTLALDVSPMCWPIGMGKEFQGCYYLHDKRFMAFPGREEEDADSWLAEQDEKTREEIALLDAVGKPFVQKSYREGHLTPVYFGSALQNFGVRELIDALHQYAPTPRPQMAITREVQPDEPKVTGFVFKIQANMDPNHRDRIAFVRLCSGTFKRGMKLKHTRSGKVFAVQSPVLFLARERSLAEEASAGDIVGIPNHGTLGIGDTLTEGEDLNFLGIPSFAPEILSHVRLHDPMRAKHLRKALEDLSEEGVSQLFKPLVGSSWLVGVVGQLQLDVLVARMETEYRINVGFERASYEAVRWIASDDKQELARFAAEKKSQIAEDLHGSLVFLARDSWDLQTVQRKWEHVRFHKTREQFARPITA
jgi:peptide chain release factor 3